MSTSSDDAKVLSTDIVAPEAVEAFLERNPAFLNDRPDLLRVLVPPEFDHGSGVVDMQMFMLDRFRDQLSKSKRREQALIDAVEANARVQRRVHRAIEVLLKAQSFEGLIRTVVEDLPELFDVGAAALCIETDKPLPSGTGATGLVILEPGSIDCLIETDQAVVLSSNIEGEKAIFGNRANKIQSMAQLQLDFGRNAPRGLLVLGAEEPETFNDSQSSDYLAFFAFVLQRCIRRWLNDGP
jgi:uncharacterized protein YigA (DUF484 family)